MSAKNNETTWVCSRKPLSHARLFVLLIKLNAWLKGRASFLGS